MLKAELGDILYYIIFAVVLIIGLMEKISKSKRQQQQAGTPRPSQPYDDFEDVEGRPASEQAPPQTLEEMMRRMLEPIETPKPEETTFYPEEAQSLEAIPALGRYFHHPEEIRIREKSEKITFSPSLLEEENEATELYEFDIRQAVIASEILNRKY